MKQVTIGDRKRSQKGKQISFTLSKKLFAEFNDTLARVNLERRSDEKITKTNLILDFIKCWIAAQKAPTKPSELRITKPPQGIDAEQMEDLFLLTGRTGGRDHKVN